MSSTSLDFINQAITNYSSNLDELKLNKKNLTRITKDIGTVININSKNANIIEIFADLLLKNARYEESVNIYIKIITARPLSLSIYKKLLLSYYYALGIIGEFNFLEILDELNVQKGSIESIYIVLAYTYIGQIYQRIGRFWDAKTAYDKALNFKSTIPQHCKFADYGKIELNFLSNIANMQSPYKSQLEELKLKPRLILGIIFFGQEYTKLFCEVAAKTLFCKSNFSVLQEHWNPVLYIFCLKSDEIEYISSQVHKHISSNIKVIIIAIPEDLIKLYPEPSKNTSSYNSDMIYSLSGLLQTCFLVLAKKFDASLINVPADSIYSNTTLKTIHNIYNRGFKIIFTTGIRLHRKNVLNKVNDIDKQYNLITRGLSVEELTNIGLNNLHPATKAAFATRDKMTYPGMILWPNKNHGLLLHCFQMHPIFINSNVIKNSPIRRFDSIDGDFSHSLIPNPKDWENFIYVITEPDKLIMFELSNFNIWYENKFHTKKLVQEAKSWIFTHMRPLSFWLVQKRIILGEFISDESNNLIKMADALMNDLIKLQVNLPDISKTDFLNLCAKANYNFERLKTTKTSIYSIHNVSDKKIKKQKILLKIRNFIYVRYVSIIFKILHMCIKLIPLSIKQKLVNYLQKMAITKGGIWAKIYFNYQGRKSLSPNSTIYY